MIKAGAFDNLEPNRNTLLHSYENILDIINSDNKKALRGQINMFENNDEVISDESLYRLIPQKELEKKYLLAMEKEVLGLYISGHPLDNLLEDIKNVSNINSVDLLLDGENEEEVYAKSNALDGKSVRFIGIISNLRTKITKNNEIMAFITIDDLEGSISTIAFPKTYAGYKNIMFEDNIVKVDGRVSVKEDEVNVVISRIETYEKNIVLNEVKEEPKKILLNISDKLSQDELAKLRNFIKLIGNQKTNTNMEITNKNITKTVKVFINDKIYKKLEEYAGEENVKWWK